MKRFGGDVLTALFVGVIAFSGLYLTLSGNVALGTNAYALACLIVVIHREGRP